MDKYQVRSCISGSGSITYDPDTGVIGGGGGGGVTPAALTKTDDTNVTLTLGGTPATALLQATSLTLGWTGQLAVARGGTGLSALGTANQLIRVNAGATALEYFTPSYLTGLTVGTTPIASGTVGRILFEGAGNVLQESANLFWNNTDNRLNINAVASPTGSLSIKSPTTTGNAIQIRNNADTANLAHFNGNAQLLTANAVSSVTLSHRTDVQGWSLTGGTGGYGTGSGIEVVGSTGGIYVVNNSFPILQCYDVFYTIGTRDAWKIINFGDNTGNRGLAFATNQNSPVLIVKSAGNIGLNTGSIGTSGVGVFAIANGTAPSSSPADLTQMYSADISAGNAALHTRAEGGQIFYAGLNVGMRSNHNLQLAANNTVYAVLSTAGRMYVGGSTTPTAVLHLAAGTATANTAPIKLTSGTLLATPEAGAIEFLTDKAYLTITTGAAREEITLNDSALTSGVTPVATTNGRLTDGLILASGTYTPTLTGVTNVSSTTAFTCQYMRVGSVVTVSGKVSVTATANNAQTVLGISLPIASNFAAEENCGGLAHTINNTAADQHGASIYADATNDRATFDYYETHGSADVFTFTFTYRII